MAKKLKKEVKKPDFFIRAIGQVNNWVKTHLKVCIVAGIAVAVLIALSVLYMSYREKKNDELQYQLSKGANLFREYLVTGDPNTLGKCEEIFKNIAKEKKTGISEIANLYLAKIKDKKGEKKEAEEILRNIANSSKSSILRELAEKALKQIQ